MPRTLGIFSLVPSYLATSGATIKTEQHNPPLEDIAQALTDSLPRDGSAPMTGALAMGSNKITGLATGTDAGDAVRFDQVEAFGYASTATVAGTTTLTNASEKKQRFTGATTQTVVLPLASTMTLGRGFEIENASTGVLTVNSSGGNVVATVASGTTASLRCILASGTTAASWSALNPIGAGRNHVYNPTGAVNQRDYVSGTATTAANQFTLDRWFVIVSGQNLTFTGTGAARVMTAPAGGVAQVIEGINIAGGTYVLNWTGTATCKVNGTTRAKGEPFTLTANTNATIAFYSGTFTEVKADKDAMTPFVYRDIDTELYSCQRYFEVMLAQQAGMAFSVANLVFGQRFRVGKRATPTMAATAHGSWVGNNSTGTVSATAFTANIDGYNTDHTAFTGSVVQGYAYVLRSYRHTADAELIA